MATELNEKKLDEVKQKLFTYMTSVGERQKTSAIGKSSLGLSSLFVHVNRSIDRPTDRPTDLIDQHWVTHSLILGRDLGIFDTIEAFGSKGCTVAEIAEKAGLKSERMLKEWALGMVANGMDGSMCISLSLSLYIYIYMTLFSFPS